MRLIIGLSILSAVSSCATNRPVCDFENPIESRCKPLKAGIIKINPEIDEVKPVAVAEDGGWAIASDVLVGPVNDQWVAGISLKNGQTLWWLKTESGVASPITMLGSWVIVGLRDGTVLKLESLTGKVVWRTELSGFVTRPFVLSGSTLLAVSVKQELLAMDFQSGKTTWIYDPQQTSDLVIRGAAPPKVVGDTVYLGVASGELHAVDLSNGRLSWKSNPAYSEFRFHDVMGEIYAENNRVVISRYDGVVTGLLVNGRTANVSWKQELSSITTSVVRNGVLYIGCVNGDVYGIEASTGRTLWKSKLSKQSVSFIFPTEKLLYVVGSNGRLGAMNSSKGTIVWHVIAEGSKE